MEREVKFRGKRVDGKGWVVGDLVKGYVHHKSGTSILVNGCLWFEVEPSTVWQYTGLKDRNGLDIFEGDVLKFLAKTSPYLPCGFGSHEINAVLVVKKLLSGFTLMKPNHVKTGETIPNLVGNVTNYNFWCHQRSFEIIGNIHDNPELLEQLKQVES